MPRKDGNSITVQIEDDALDKLNTLKTKVHIKKWEVVNEGINLYYEKMRKEFDLTT